MEKITKQQAVEELKILFDYENHNENNDVIVSEENGKTTFMVNKTYVEGMEVIDRLQEFFRHRFIEDGQCRVCPITFIYTTFHIEDRC